MYGHFLLMERKKLFQFVLAMLSDDEIGLLIDSFLILFELLANEKQ
jgi:hypothetical protein